MAIKTDTFEVITVWYKGEVYPAEDFKGILNLCSSIWPRKLKVWDLKRLPDGEVFSMYDMTQFGRITGFNTGNAFDEPYAYFQDSIRGQKLEELKKIK